MDNDVKEAYEKLGLSETASREEVEKRYERLLRREKQKMKASGRTEDSAELTEINKAYRTIWEYEDRKAVEQIAAQEYGKYKRLSGLMRKTDHFFQYYKWHIFIGIAIVAGLIYGIIAYLDHRAEQERLALLPPPDLEAVFIGRFDVADQEKGPGDLAVAMTQQIPGWKRVVVTLRPLKVKNQDMYDISMMQKVIAELTVEVPDIYILDSDTFDWLVKTKVLRSLDAEAEGRWKPFLPKEKAVWASLPAEDEKGKTKQEKHIYGIDVGDSRLAKKLPLVKQDMIVGIRANAKHPEKALEWIENYLREIPR